MSKKEQEFRGELKALLKKHGASISFSVSDCSDTYGLYDECLVVDFDPNNQPRNYSPPSKLVDGWCVAEEDL